MITQERLKELLNYDPDTGVFTWKKTNTNYVKIGSIAGTKKSTNRYCNIKIDKVIYLSHRLAFLYMTGSIPVQVDHEDGNRQNNKWSNLREANNSTNQMNSRKTKNKKSSIYKGVYLFNKRLKKPWRACITYNKKIVSLGFFLNEEDAARAYDKAAIEYFGEFANLNFNKDSLLTNGDIWEIMDEYFIRKYLEEMR